MKKEIVVRTQNGNGGPVTVAGRWASGPRNLLAAIQVAREMIDEGVSGSRTWIEVGGKVLSNWGPDSWPNNMEEARENLEEMFN